MDLSVSATASTYLPVQGHAQQAGVRGNNGAETQDYLATSGGSRRDQTSRTETALVTPETQKAQEEAARRKDPSAEVSRTPGFSFEYQDNHQVMKVHNAKGVLIYQVPSKGQLALIQAEDNTQLLGQQLRLTA